MNSESEIQSKAISARNKSFKLFKSLNWRFIIQKSQYYLHKFQILNFMLVGGIGYAINMLIYWPLTLVFKNEVSFLGQQFYLPHL